jgi:hypothetical protein
VYIDTCIVSGLARNDLKPAEQIASQVLAKLAQDSRVSLVSSHIVREELEKIPPQVRGPHLAQNALLGELSSARTTWLNPTNTESASHPVYLALSSALPDRMDAEHIFQAYSSGLTTFLTTDEKTILRHRDVITQIAHVNAMLPTEFVGSSSLTSACSRQALPS